MNKAESKIFLIDDDEDIRSGIALLLKSIGYNVESFKNVSEFLEFADHTGPGCILLDIFLGEETGLELQSKIEIKFESLPIIYITGQGNIPMSVQAMKKGAINFLQKPIDDKELMKAIEEALTTSDERIRKQNEIEKFKSLVSSLTAREYEIFRYVITGMLNKQIAAELGIAEHTVKNHRLSITDKLGIKSVAEMIYMAEKLSIKTS
ncbi:MAG: response regulator [Ignavibacteriaceae bacterium]|jgi:FixJ family two-component response regulator|nr:response regulator [Ignavibacteriaceae bacterium]MCU0413161.1 response regulator [Ignavibacteriaceae bacterium]